MNKGQIDELYHNLRVLNVEGNIIEKEAIAGITSHLTKAGGDYNGLLRFLSYYGDNYVLPDVLSLLRSAWDSLNFTRVIELGAGFGWLGRGVSREFGDLPLTLVDKRQFMGIDIVADIETKNGIERVLDFLDADDIIVMSELLHCLDNPADVMKPFAKWPKLVVEYLAVDLRYEESYNTQIRSFGCTTLPDIHDIFPNSEILTSATDTHRAWVIIPK